jgi:hypothetical protein
MLDDFLSAIDLPKSRIVNHPRYIFLCGGPVPSNTPTAAPPSLRYSLIQRIASHHPGLSTNIVLAETLFDKVDPFKNDDYRDLLTFERYIASFCSAIVIILESPGAIAEFGSFVLLEDVVDKLYAVIDSSHYTCCSFIRKGPIEYLQQRQEKQVISHNWLTAKGIRPSVPKFRLFAPDLIDELADIHRSDQSSHKVDLSLRAHHMLLLASLLRVAQPLRLGEIEQCMHAISQAINRQEVRRYLSMLQILGLVQKHRHGHIDYYANIKNLDFVEWRFQPDEPRNQIVRWIIDFRTFFTKTDKKRMTALRNWPKSG